MELEARIGPEGAHISHRNGAVVPVPLHSKGGDSAGGTPAPALAIGLSVTGVGVVLCGILVYYARTRRAVLPGNLPEPPRLDDRERDGEWGGDKWGAGVDRTGGVGRGGGGEDGGRGTVGSWSDRDWSGPSFSVNLPIGRTVKPPPKAGMGT